MSIEKIAVIQIKKTNAVIPSGIGHFLIALHFKSCTSYYLCDGVHSPFRAVVVPDTILDPSVTDHPHHRDAIADPDFDCECVGALTVPRYLHLAVPFAAVYLTAGRSLGAGVGEAVLLNELAEVLVRFFDCHCVFLLAFVTTSKPEKNEKVQNEKQKTAATRNNSMWLLLFCRLSVSTECSLV